MVVNINYLICYKKMNMKIKANRVVGLFLTLPLIGLVVYQLIKNLHTDKFWLSFIALFGLIAGFGLIATGFKMAKKKHVK